MAISVNTVWEVRPTNGADTNGGGFVAGSGGTDYSQQNAKNTSGSNKSTTDAVGAGTTTITSATAAFTSTITGNIIYLAGGSGSLSAGWYQATYVSATSITVDRTVASGTGITMNIGGAFQTLSNMTSVLTNFAAAGNAFFIKAESTIVLTAGVSFAAGSGLQCRCRGYTTTRGDNGKATIQLSTNSSLTALTFGANWDVANLIVDCNSLAGSVGITFNGTTGRLSNCTVKNFTSIGINLTAGSGAFYNNEITSGGSASLAAFSTSTLSGGQVQFIGNWVHDNACPGIRDASALGIVIAANLISNNTGASSDGILLSSPTLNYTIYNNTIYKSGRHGINFSGVAILATGMCFNNLITDSGGYGFVGAESAGSYASPFFDGNAYYNNTSGNREYLDDTGSTNPINGTPGLIYTNVHDVVCTVSPYNIPGSDYSLNSIAGGGQALKGTGVPTSILNYTGTNPEYAGDFGCLPSQPKPAQKLFHRLGRRQSLQ